MNNIEKFAQFIRESKKIVFFGGAGVSTESGLPDYRSSNGIYNTALQFGLPPEKILSRECFMSDPELFYRFYRAYFMNRAKPNGAHSALAKLEKKRDVTVITQNIDGLHTAAGSSNVLELHGNASSFHCCRCNRAYGIEFIRHSHSEVPRCVCGNIIKPDVVLYGEELDETVVRSALDAISRADLLIIGGTSLSVYPAAGYLRAFTGDRIVLINRDVTRYDSAADIVFRENISDVLTSVISTV